MPKDSYYIKLDVNAPEDTKVKVLRKHHGNMEGFGSYIFIALKLRQEENCYLEYDDFTFEALSIDIGKTPEEVKQFIDDCIKLKLFQKVNEKFFSERVNRDKAILDERRNKTSLAGKISAEKRWGKPVEQASTLTKVPIEASDKNLRLKTNVPEPLITDELRTEFKEIDIDEELKKFTLYWSEGKRKLKRPKTAFRNWLIKAREFKQEKQPAKPARRTYDDGMEGMKIE